MTTWSLTQLLSGLHDDIERRLDTARKSFAHAPTKGDASEHVWRDFLETYLPKRYQTATAHVADSKGNFSDQIDVVIFDRHYSPLIFQYEGQTIIPAESVYAVFESKQTINSEIIRYARQKAASVRDLHRTIDRHCRYLFSSHLAYARTSIIGTVASSWSLAISSRRKVVAAFFSGINETV
jgi:hypothetical protein